LSALNALLSLPGVFVTGTDTGVGKTEIACALVRAARGLGWGVGVMKPVATGMDENEGLPEDTRRLMDASFCSDPAAWVTPIRFHTPCAPPIAARREGGRVDWTPVEEAYRKLRRRHSCLIVEGVGGVRSPMTDREDCIDWAVRFGLPLVLVVPVRLGMINQAALALDAIRSRAAPAGSGGIRLSGVVLNHLAEREPPTASEDVEWLRLRHPEVEMVEYRRVQT
jgi:dethiobiotin synthetase